MDDQKKDVITYVCQSTAPKVVPEKLMQSSGWSDVLVVDDRRPVVEHQIR